MKLYKHFAIGILAILALGSCSDEFDEDVSLNISVVTSDDVSYDGQIVTVTKGSTVDFTIDGDPDYLTFFSGEYGYKYYYRDRTSIDADLISSSTLDFGLMFMYGSISMIDAHFYISTEFPGMAKDDFESDSILVEQYVADGLWEEFLTQDQFPAVVSAGGSATSYSIDMYEYLGDTITLAISYEGIDNTKVQPILECSDMHFTNVLTSGQTVEFSSSSFGFTPLNMKNKWNLSDQASADLDDPEYGSASTYISGLWYMGNISNETFRMHSSVAGADLKYGWLVSDRIVISSCSPDTGVVVKNISETVTSYSYTYEDVGIYTAVFLATNANIDHSSSTTQQFIINVVE